MLFDRRKFLEDYPPQVILRNQLTVFRNFLQCTRILQRLLGFLQKAGSHLVPRLQQAIQPGFGFYSRALRFCGQPALFLHRGKSLAQLPRRGVLPE